LQILSLKINLIGVNQFIITLHHLFKLHRLRLNQTKRRTGYDLFINKLKRIPNFNVYEGRCQKVDGEFHQKGVDTLLTMGLMEFAIQNKGGTIIIIACDTDFVPILNSIRKNMVLKLYCIIIMIILEVQNFYVK